MNHAWCNFEKEMDFTVIIIRDSFSNGFLKWTNAGGGYECQTFVFSGTRPCIQNLEKWQILESSDCCLCTRHSIALLPKTKSIDY